MFGRVTVLLNMTKVWCYQMSYSPYFAFSNRKNNKSGSDNVISTSEQFKCEQGGRHDQTNTVNRPEGRLKISFRDYGPQ